jgi:hypothetical protein
MVYKPVPPLVGGPVYSQKHQSPCLPAGRQAPAFADLLAEQVLWQARAASRRQAKSQTISKFQFRMTAPHPSPRGRVFSTLPCGEREEVRGFRTLEIIWNLPACR